MRRTSNLPALLAACAAAFAQAPSDSTASVQGIVTNSVTGEPVLRAHVVLQGTDNAQGGQNPARRYGALTTVEGKFSVTGVAPGGYSLVLDKTGFVTAMDIPPVVLQAGDHNSDLKLKLVPTGSVTGRVLNADGEPVENAFVTAETGRNSAGAGARTDEKGHYRIGGLTPGKYRIRANSEELPGPPEIRSDGSHEIHYAATYYPSVLLPRDAARAEARAGVETSGVDIRLVRTPIVRVSGTVSGLPPGARDARIEVRNGSATSSGAMVKPDGTFVLWKLDPGKYTIYAVLDSRTGAQLQSSSADLEVSDADIDHVALNIIPPMELSGRVEFDDEQARPQSQGRSPAARRIMLLALDGAASLPIDLGPDDSFRVSGLTPSRYHVSLGWGPAFVKAMRLGPAVIDGAVLDLRNGAAGGALALVVSSAMASLAGTVTAGSGPAAAAIVALVPDDHDGAAQTFHATANPDGTYSLGAIAAGRYRIAAVDPADLKDIEALIDQMETVELHPGEKLTKDLTRMKR